MCLMLLATLTSMLDKCCLATCRLWHIWSSASRIGWTPNLQTMENELFGAASINGCWSLYFYDGILLVQSKCMTAWPTSPQDQGANMCIAGDPRDCETSAAHIDVRQQENSHNCRPFTWTFHSAQSNEQGSSVLKLVQWWSTSQNT